MAKNILITPSPTGTTNPSIAFSGETAKMITLEVLSGGTLAFNSSGGTMFSIDDTTTGSLFSVNDISGLPILEVFSDDRLVAGKFGTDAFVVSGTNVNINGTLIATGTSYLNTISATTISADTIYTHTISGMSPVNINGVVIENDSVYSDTISASTIYYGTQNLNDIINFYQENIVLLSGASWDSTAYTQTVAITSTTLSDDSILWVSPSASRANIQNYSNADILAISNTLSSVTFECVSIPTSNIDISLTIKKSN